MISQLKPSQPAALAAVLLSGGFACCLGAEPADLVVRHANVLTVDARRPKAAAFAVRGENFVAVGASEEMTPWIGPGTKVLDLAGKTVVPGFIDAHLHPRRIYPEDSEWASVDVSPARVRTIEDLVAALKRKADKMEVYGEKRWDWMHPARSLIDLGVPLAGHSDDPVSAADPLLRVQDMVLRTSAEGKTYGPLQRITAAEALRVWTLGGAYASFEEHVKGSIETGKLADFVVLSGDPTEVPPEKIKDLEVEKTFVGGRLVHDGDNSVTIHGSSRRGLARRSAG